MPLTMPLPAGSKIIINGAVIENSGASGTSITVHNQANILRDKDVLTDKEADTPAKEIYFAIQNAYLFPDNQDEWLNMAQRKLDHYGKLLPVSAPVVDDVRQFLGEGRVYNALKASRKLQAIEVGGPVASGEPPSTGGGKASGGRAGGGKAAAGKSGASTKQREIERIHAQIADLQRRMADLAQS